ncbi:hypothetical protein QCA50_021052 [Cerrena zonata]|uniref:Uncharacterized protein n=1 Tax=Cerrena zonata TaxID=2478898 RepID=A0AAW0FBC7_9APHY
MTSNPPAPYRSQKYSAKDLSIKLFATHCKALTVALCCVCHYILCIGLVFLIESLHEERTLDWNLSITV